MGEIQRSPNVIVIGAGPSAISMAHTMKHKMGFDNFMLYDKLDGPGGTWRANSYPGCGCDVPTQLYSFHFELNPDWSKEMCDREEILEYMERTVDKYNLRPHMLFGIYCLGAKWHSDRGQWEVRFRDNLSKLEFSRYATVLVSAVGGIAEPRDVKFEGMEDFKGDMFHTARWNHQCDYTGKRIAVIGNGCSAAQVVPSITPKAASIKQYARSPQWYHERPNRPFTALEKWCCRYIPLWQRYLRLHQFFENDSLVETYVPGEEATKARARAEADAKDYIYRTAPEKYHSFIVPDFPLGCKRRVFDPGYLESLHSPKVELVPEGIQKMTETGIISSSGVQDDFDVIILATGFKVQEFLTPLEIIGSNGVSLERQWDESRGPQAYFGTTVHNFPNFGILFGPNTFPAHNSVLFSCEVQVSYFARAVLAPIIDRRVRVLDVKEAREHIWTNTIYKQLEGYVFSAGCSNWYIDKFGNNAASFPGYASDLWKQAWFTTNGLADYDTVPDEKVWWFFRMISRWITTTIRPRKKTVSIITAAVLLMVLRERRRKGGNPLTLGTIREVLRSVQGSALGLARSLKP